MRRRPTFRSCTKALETDTALTFELQLAKDLGMTVARLRHEMGCDEFRMWNVWYAREGQKQQLAAKKR